MLYERTTEDVSFEWSYYLRIIEDHVNYMIPEGLSFRNEFDSRVKFVLHSHDNIVWLSLRRSDSRDFRARSGTHAPLARRLHDLRFSIQNGVRFQFNDTRMKFRSRTRISFGMKTGMKVIPVS